MTFVDMAAMIDTSADPWVVPGWRMLWLARELFLAPRGGALWRSVESFCVALHEEPRADQVREALFELLQRVADDQVRVNRSTWSRAS